MTQLYSANLEELAKPIKKGGRKRKVEETAPASPPPTEVSEVSEPVPKETPVEIKPEPVETPVHEPPAKKPKSEKQLAALERARERRRLAKEEKERQEQEEAARQAAIEAAKEAKREAAKEKRRLAREAKLLAETGLEPIPEKGQVIKNRRSRPVYREDHEPPVWFKKYIETVKTEQAKLGTEKKAQKVIKEEAHQAAQEHWGDQPTRSRVTHEVDNHMNRMYSMIFGKR
jgi:colicin import membrane protein